MCGCGCGQPAPLAKRNETKRGIVKGQPFAFVVGHNARLRSRGIVIEDRGFETPCWVQQGATSDRYGYVYVTTRGKRGYAHRLAYEQAKGPVPDGYEVDHLCRVTRCVNPDHLEAVTPTVNNRRRTVVRANEEMVKAIRAAPAGYGTGVALAERFGITPQMVCEIRKGKTWKDVA